MADEPQQVATSVDPDQAAEPGAGLVSLVRLGTGVLVVASIAAAVAPDPFGVVHAGLSVAPLRGRHRRHALGLRPRRVAQPHRARHDPRPLPPRRRRRPARTRRAFRIATAVEVVAVVAAASVRPFTEVAFGILAPMFGLGLMGLWGGRYGEFPPRPLKQPE